DRKSTRLNSSHVETSYAVFCLKKKMTTRGPMLRRSGWSCFGSSFQSLGYWPFYTCVHYGTKGRISNWLTTKPLSTQADAFKWTVFTNGPYAEMLYGGNFMPEILDDGTRVFAAPLGKGHVPIITLPDFFFIDRSTSDIYTLSLHDALPI